MTTNKITVEVQAYQGKDKPLPMVSIVEFEFVGVDGKVSTMKEVCSCYEEAEKVKARHEALPDLYKNVRILNYIIWN